MRDPQKQEQNQEVMDLYKRHGVNPLGAGCMPLLLQIPFFFAFYKVLSVSIEMRGANWLWVSDLSQPETLAIRILPARDDRDAVRPAEDDASDTRGGSRPAEDDAVHAAW